LTEKAPVDAFFDTWLEDNLDSQILYHGLANAHPELLAEGPCYKFTSRLSETYYKQGQQH
jgi:hypothetical protein